MNAMKTNHPIPLAIRLRANSVFLSIHAMVILIALTLFLVCICVPVRAADLEPAQRLDGYRGIWYQISKGSNVAYSGGLGTYPPHIRPLAVYAAEANKTFFVWGGAGSPQGQHLRIMISYYDHQTGMVPRPVVVRDAGRMGDAHANPSMTIDPQGHIWVFAARRHGFPGHIYRSVKPYDISAFRQLGNVDAYPQAWPVTGQGMLLLETAYSGGRGNHWRTTRDGQTWTEPQRLFRGGNYASSFEHNGRIFVASDWHNRGSDNRTNVYMVMTGNLGQTWTNITGEPITTPMRFPDNPALVRDYNADNRYVFLNDMKVDHQGHPMILYVSSRSGAYGPGPGGDPRHWTLARWDGRAWQFSLITRVDHNYDYGNIHVEADGTCVAVGPTERGPQPATTGGEIAMWVSKDQGRTWTRERQLTRNSSYNHTFVRIPLQPHPDFFAFWTDGHTGQRSESRLYFTTRDGKVFRLPPAMTGEYARPEPYQPGM
jgi:hypothetical protein